MAAENADDGKVKVEIKQAYTVRIERLTLADFTVEKSALMIRGKKVEREPMIVHHAGPFIIPLILDFHLNGAIADGDRCIGRLIVENVDDIRKIYVLLSGCRNVHSRIFATPAIPEEGLQLELRDLQLMLQLLNTFERYGLIGADISNAEVALDLAENEVRMLNEIAQRATDLARYVRESAADRLTGVEKIGNPDFYEGRIIPGDDAVPSKSDGAFTVEGYPEFVPSSLITTTLTDSWSPALFAASFADGTFGIVFTMSRRARNLLLGITEEDESKYDDLAYPLLPEVAGECLIQAAGYLTRRLPAEIPAGESVSDPLSVTMCRWFTETVIRYAADAYVRASNTVFEIPSPDGTFDEIAGKAG